MRIHIVGNAGAGKSTLARRLATMLDCPHIELDALFWEPNWQSAPDEIFRERVEAATAGDCWIADGNYRRIRETLWQRVQMVVWLDYSLWWSLRRLTQRGVQRIRSQEDLWGTGNRETWRGQFLSRDSLYVWAIKTHREKRLRYAHLMADPSLGHIAFVHLRSPRSAQRWLRAFEQANM